MSNITEKEKDLISEAISTILQLPPELQERLIWMGQGMVLAGGANERARQTSN